MIRSTLCTLTKHTMGRVRRRTSTKHRSRTFVVQELAPERSWTLNERESLGPISSQPRHERGIRIPPPARERAGGVFSLGPTGRLIDRLGVCLHRGGIAPPNPAHQIAELRTQQR